MWNLKNDTNELICKNRLTVIEKKKLTFTEGERDKIGVWDSPTTI